MFIELTDHLRCPAEHDEAFLVLLPEAVDDRGVRSGMLGCPVCQAEYRIADGVVRFGEAPHPAGAPPLRAEAVHAFLGLSGPGGYAALVGDVAGVLPDLVGLDPGVHFAAIDAPAGVTESRAVSVLLADRIPFKRASLRGVVLGGGYGGDDRWVGEARRVLLPGLRMAGSGPAPERADVQVLAEADGWWVGVGK